MNVGIHVWLISTLPTSPHVLCTPQKNNEHDSLNIKHNVNAQNGVRDIFPHLFPRLEWALARGQGLNFHLHVREVACTKHLMSDSNINKLCLMVCLLLSDDVTSE